MYKERDIESENSRKECGPHNTGYHLPHNGANQDKDVMPDKKAGKPILV